MIITWTNFVELESSMLYIKIQPQSFLGSAEEHFQEFYMADILFNCEESFKENGNTLSTEDPCEIWWKLLKQFQRRRHLNLTPFYTCI